jgi:hypothetical protein
MIGSTVCVKKAGIGSVGGSIFADVPDVLLPHLFTVSDALHQVIVGMAADPLAPNVRHSSVLIAIV